MAKKKLEKRNESKRKYDHHHAGNGACIYGTGFIGAIVYYTSTASGFWIGVLGFLKALVWPAFLVYEALKFLGA